MDKYEIMYSSPNYQLINKDTGIIIEQSPDETVIRETKEELEEDS